MRPYQLKPLTHSRYSISCYFIDGSIDGGRVTGDTSQDDPLALVLPNAGAAGGEVEVFQQYISQAVNHTSSGLNTIDRRRLRCGGKFRIRRKKRRNKQWF